MVLIKSGKDWKNEVCEFYLDDNLNKNLNRFIPVVRKKDFDLPICICGLPGIGKTNLGVSIAKKCDENFTIDNIAFSAEEFIEKTNACEKGAAIVLDESFADLNSKVTMSAAYLKVINHLQLLRQKNLFLILILPSFFDLSKGVAIFRTAFLITAYGKQFGDRGSFALYDRDRKRVLYIKGSKYMDYSVVSPNFRGRFTKQRVIDEQEYNKRKKAHLLAQQQTSGERQRGKTLVSRNKVLAYMYSILKIPQKKLADIADVTKDTINLGIAAEKEGILARFRGEIENGKN